MTTTTLLRKIEVPFSLKTANEAIGEFSGYASTWSLDLQRDRIIKGAFARTIKEAEADRVEWGGQFLYPLLWMHNPHEPVGGLYEVREDAKGLRIRGYIDLDVEQGRRAFSALKKGYVGSFSIGYKSRVENYDKAGIRLLYDLDLVEVSIVSFPANREARVLDVKTSDRMSSLLDDMKRTVARLGAQKGRVNVRIEERPDGYIVFQEANEGEKRADVYKQMQDALRRDDDLYQLHGKARDNEIALRKQQREKRQAEQKALLEAERAERAERQRLMAAPSFTPSSFALATGLDESWLRVRFQGWAASGLVTVIDEATLTLAAPDVKRMAQREHGQFEARFIEMAARRAQGGR